MKRAGFTVGSEVNRLTAFLGDGPRLPKGRIVRHILDRTVTVLDGQSLTIEQDPDLNVPIAVVRDFEDRIVQTAFCEVKEVQP